TRVSRDWSSDVCSSDLQYSDEIENYYDVTDKALVLYASPEDKNFGKARYTLYFGQSFPEVKFQFDSPLSQAKIAIDPGHFGGQRSEERRVGKACGLRRS